MLEQLPFDLDLPRWEALVIPVIGLASAGLTLLVAGRLLRNRPLLPESPTEETVQNDPFVYGSATEKRVSARRFGNFKKVLISDAEAKTHATEGWVIDRSMGGLCLALLDPVRENSVLTIRSADPADESPWVPVQVKRSRSKGSHWEVGCEFMRNPPYSALLQFG